MRYTSFMSQAQNTPLAVETVTGAPATTKTRRRDGGFVVVLKIGGRFVTHRQGHDEDELKAELAEVARNYGRPMTAAEETAAFAHADAALREKGERMRRANRGIPATQAEQRAALDEARRRAGGDQVGHVN